MPGSGEHGGEGIKADGLSAATAVVTVPSAVGGYAQSGVLQVGASLAALAYYLFL